MSKFGIVDAKNRLSELLERAARGEDVITTRGGEPIAGLMPAQMPDPKAQAQAQALALASRIRASRKAQSLTPERGPELSLRELIEEGRR